MPSRFKADYSDPNLVFEPLVDEVFSELKSSFLEMPKGDGFIEYDIFETGYQALKKATLSFREVREETVRQAVESTPIAFIVFRAILGFTPF